MSANSTFSLKFVVKCRQLSRFPAKMTLVHARALLGIEKISLSSLDLKVSYKLFKPTGEQINRVSIIYPIVVINSLCCRRNLTAVSSVCEAILVLCRPRTWRITGNALRSSLQPDQQIDNGFCNRPIMARSEILLGLDRHLSAVSRTDLSRPQLFKRRITLSTG